MTATTSREAQQILNNVLSEYNLMEPRRAPLNVLHSLINQLRAIGVDENDPERRPGQVALRGMLAELERRARLSRPAPTTLGPYSQILFDLCGPAGLRQYLRA